MVYWILLGVAIALFMLCVILDCIVSALNRNRIKKIKDLSGYSYTYKNVITKENKDL